MSQAQWSAVDEYIASLWMPDNAILEETLRRSEAAGLPAIHVAPTHGQFLMLLARSIGAKSILEIGTLGGYSTIWLAQALPDEGELVTLEVNPHHATVARENLSRAGVIDKADIRVGEALHTLAQLASEPRKPFDFIFVDADKENNTAYFEWALRLARVGSVIIVDNVVRNGEVIDADSTDSRVQGVRRFYERVSREPRVTSTALQTVGSKGYDGFAMVLVVA